MLKLSDAELANLRLAALRALSNMADENVAPELLEQATEKLVLWLLRPRGDGE